jgi:hypothetical protein
MMAQLTVKPRSWPWCGCRQRGPVGSTAATARSRGVGPAATSAASLCSIPSLLTGLISREVTADAVDTTDDVGVHSASG